MLRNVRCKDSKFKELQIRYIFHVYNSKYAQFRWDIEQVHFHILTLPGMHLRKRFELFYSHGTIIGDTTIFC